MHETDSPDPAAPPSTTDGPVDEEESLLDGFEADLDGVAAALDALDADDLAAAEALVAGLADLDSPVVDET